MLKPQEIKNLHKEIKWFVFKNSQLPKFQGIKRVPGMPKFDK